MSHEWGHMMYCLHNKLGKIIPSLLPVSFEKPATNFRCRSSRSKLNSLPYTQTYIYIERAQNILLIWELISV